MATWLMREATDPLPEGTIRWSPPRRHKPRHLEAARFEFPHQRLALRRGELDERRPYRRPIRVASEMRDDRFQRRHHGIFLHDARVAVMSF